MLEEQFDHLRVVVLSGQVDWLLAAVIRGVSVAPDLNQRAADLDLTRLGSQMERCVLCLRRSGQRSGQESGQRSRQPTLGLPTLQINPAAGAE